MLSIKENHSTLRGLNRVQDPDQEPLYKEHLLSSTGQNERYLVKFTPEARVDWLKLCIEVEEKLKAGGRFPSGYCHFPEYDEEFFKQITAEQKVVTTNKKGFEVFAWEKTRKDNHFLDCRNYARAGATMLQIDRMRDEDWDLRESMFEGTVTVDSDNSTNDTTQNTSPTRRKRRRSNWLNN